MITPCPLCKGFIAEEKELFEHHSLLTISYEETKVGESEFVFFCTDCCAFIQLVFSYDEPLKEGVSWYEPNWTDDFSEKMALALFASNRKDYMEKRKSFLSSHTIPIYEPIDENELVQLKKVGDVDSKVPIATKPDIWYDNVEDCLNSFSEEDEWEATFQFSYADPLDLQFLSSTPNMPRFFRTYLVPADEIEFILKTEKSQSCHLSIWKQSLSRIEKISYWDHLTQRHILQEELLAISESDSLWMEVSEKDKINLLKPYSEWIQERLKSEKAEYMHK